MVYIVKIFKFFKARFDQLIVDDEQGFILVSVIWIVGLIAVMGTAFAMIVRSHTMTVSNESYNSKAEAIADGVTRYAIIQLLKPNVAGDVNGTHKFCSWDEKASVSISLQDQGGLVDINTASPQLLEKLLLGLGEDAAQSARLLEALNEFKGPLQQAHLDLSDLYPNKSFGPKHEALISLDELDQIPGFSQQLLQKLRRLVTVYSQQTGIDPSKAPSDLRDILGPIAVPAEFTSPSAQKVFSIDVLSELHNGARFHRQAIIVILGQPDRPFSILSWQPKYEDDPKRLPTNNPPCIN